MKQHKNKQEKRAFPIWTVGLSLGVIMLTIGALNDQLADIYRKAVMICLECIGIG